MNQQDQQAIDELFQRLYQTAAQAGPRDPEAEARIQQHVQQGPPGLLYHMAQTLVAQQYALQQARAELAACQQQNQQPSGAPAGFAPPQPPGAGQSGYGSYGPPPSYQQAPGPYQQASPPPAWPQARGSGFLAGAGRLALGVGGGILAAEALNGLLGGGGLFGDRDDDGDRDFGDRDDDGDRGDTQDSSGPGDGQDYGAQDDYGNQDYGDGGFGDGGFDGDQGGW
jgi:hypothetical protein